MGKVFRFESIWLKDPRCEEVVQDAWEEVLAANQEFALSKCLESCHAQLEGWNKEEFGHVGRRITELQKHLEWLELQSKSPSTIQDIRAIRYELNDWLDKENVMWLQRSRKDWLQLGDRNTRFFMQRLCFSIIKISLMDYWIWMMCGTRMTIEWRQLWWSTIRTSLPLATQQSLMNFSKPSI